MTNDEVHALARAIGAANHHPEPDAYADRVLNHFTAHAAAVAAAAAAPAPQAEGTQTNPDQAADEQPAAA